MLMNYDYYYWDVLVSYKDYYYYKVGEGIIIVNCKSHGYKSNAVDTTL